MPDADMDRFTRLLKDTQAGLRLRLAITEAGIAVRKIRELRQHKGLRPLEGSAYEQLQSWRQQYIKTCEYASSAIGELWDKYQWPTDGARAVSYRYQPKDPA
jgi:hypothetical protein